MMRRMMWSVAGAVAMAGRAFAAGEAGESGMGSGTLSLHPAVLQAAQLAAAREGESAVRATLYWENDGGWAKPIDRHDRHYTSGVGASLSWQAPWVDSLVGRVPSINNEFDPGQTDYAMGFVGALTMYTPERFEQTQPIFNDRPFAGFTYGGLFVQRANRTLKLPTYESLEVDVGILGPSSLAQNAQEMVHHFFDYRMPRGWGNQVNDEPDFMIKYDRRWRWDAWTPPEEWQPWAPRVQVMPEVGFTVGSLLDEVHAGGIVRVGWNMPDDFGPGRMSLPADFTFRAPAAGGPFSLEDVLRKQSFYFFVRPYGELVARNGLLEGDTFSDRDPVTVSPVHGVFGVEYGLSHRFLKHFEFTYSWTSESAEFKGQRGWDTWGSVSLSFFVSW